MLGILITEPLAQFLRANLDAAASKSAEQTLDEIVNFPSGVTRATLSEAVKTELVGVLGTDVCHKWNWLLPSG
jgi:hypothetical protein